MVACAAVPALDPRVRGSSIEDNAVGLRRRADRDVAIERDCLIVIAGVHDN